ncbi:MAG: ester cyclase [Thermomicrobiales bacterium]
MSAETLVLAFIERVWNGGELDAIPQFIAPDYAIEGAAVGPAWVQTNVGGFRTAFTDLSMTVERVVSNETQVAVLVRLDAVHTGLWKGFAATGRVVSYREAAFWEVDPERNMIVSGDFVADTLMARMQLGIVSADVWRGSDT